MVSRQLSPARRYGILRITVWLGLAMLLASRVSWNVADLDIWHQMALIRESVAAGRLLTGDVFAYTPVLPYIVHHEWGAGAIAYALASASGAAGVLAWKYLLALILAVLAARCAWARGATLATFSLAAPLGIMFAGAAFSPIRGHLYSLCFAALLLWALERDRDGGRRWILWWLPLFPLWVNLHGGFVVGIGLAGVYCLEQLLTRRPWLHMVGVVAAMGALVTVNPYGLAYYPHLARALAMKRPGISEWRPMLDSFPSVYSVAFVAALAVAAWTVAKLGWRAAPGLGCLLVTAAATLQHARMMPFFALAFVCYVPGYLEQTGVGPRLRASFERGGLAWQAAWTSVALFFLFAAIEYQPWRLRVPGDGPADEISYPVGAVDYLLDNHFRGNIMTPFEAGAYVSWRMYPAARVSVDSRYEAAYPEGWVDSILRLYHAAPGWEALLRRHPTDVVVVRRTHQLGDVIAQAGWRRVYADRGCSVWARPGLDLPPVDNSGRVVDGRFP